MEDEFPGLWRLWFENQCVSDGHSPHVDGPGGWKEIPRGLDEIEPGHLIVVALPGRRIARIGEVVRNNIEHKKWEPLIEGNPKDRSGWKHGYMGRRIQVRWELENAPDVWDEVIQLPANFNMRLRGTLHRIHTPTPSVKKFRDVIANRSNWVKMSGRFGYEQALSDYIAHYPHKLKSGLTTYPDDRVRERVLGDDSRTDVLLRETAGKPVIVECKQDSPTVDNIQQLCDYIRKLKNQTGEQARGILVHGGARTVDEKVWRKAKKSPGMKLEIFQYILNVEFEPSFRPNR
jgi:hypothetical protein